MKAQDEYHRNVVYLLDETGIGGQGRTKRQIEKDHQLTLAYINALKASKNKIQSRKAKAK